MTWEERVAALEALVEGMSQRLLSLERRIDHQATQEAQHHSHLREMREGIEALEEQTPANSATREVMWRRIEALEGAPSEELPPMIADILRRLAALEERKR
jgi:predicted  nucleic acid-binding Zn-ribbon protein